MGSSYSNVTPSVKYAPAVEKEIPDLKGKKIAITGTTSGTGYAAAKCLAAKGATIFMLNRKSERSEAAEKKIREEVKGCNVSTIECDLMSFASVRAAAEKLKKTVGEDGLDGLGLNAGIMAMEDLATKDGCDIQMQVNHLSHFLLTSELWPAIKTAADKRGDARVVTMSSIARKGNPFSAKHYGKNGGDLGGDADPSNIKSGPRWERYHQTKLANCVYVHALTDKINKSEYKGKIKAIVAHPGLSATNLQVSANQKGSMPSWFRPIFSWMAMAPFDGALGLIQGLTKKDVASGSFIGPQNYREFCGPPVMLPVSDMENNNESKKALWEESEKSTGCSFKV